MLSLYQKREVAEKRGLAQNSASADMQISVGKVPLRGIEKH